MEERKSNETPAQQKSPYGKGTGIGGGNNVPEKPCRRTTAVREKRDTGFGK